MSQPPTVPPRGANRPDRRTNLVLRALIDDLLERVREMHSGGGAWSPVERTQAEAELEAIMSLVRLEAARPRARSEND